MNNPETLYECLSVLQQQEELAEENDGVISDGNMEAIVKAHTTSMEKLQSLVGYIKFCEGQELICKNEIDRIQARKKTFSNRLASVKKYLLPWVIEQKKKTGKNTIVGTITLGTRKSQSVELDEGFNNMDYCEKVETIKPDKKKIKEFLKANPGMYILGASLNNNVNLSIK